MSADDKNKDLAAIRAMQGIAAEEREAIVNVAKNFLPRDVADVAGSLAEAVREKQSFPDSTMHNIAAGRVADSLVRGMTNIQQPDNDLSRAGRMREEFGVPQRGVNVEGLESDISIITHTSRTPAQIHNILHEWQAGTEKAMRAAGWGNKLNPLVKKADMVHEADDGYQQEKGAKSKLEAALREGVEDALLPPPPKAVTTPTEHQTHVKPKKHR